VISLPELIESPRITMAPIIIMTDITCDFITQNYENNLARPDGKSCLIMTLILDNVLFAKLTISIMATICVPAGREPPQQG
jgi:hypothetical protein